MRGLSLRQISRFYSGYFPHIVEITRMENEHELGEFVEFDAFLLLNGFSAFSKPHGLIKIIPKKMSSRAVTRFVKYTVKEIDEWSKYMKGY